MVFPVEAEVAKRETVDVPDEKFDCFPVELNLGKAGNPVFHRIHNRDR